MIGVMVPSGFSAYEPCKEPNMSNHPACAEVVAEKAEVEKAAAEEEAARKAEVEKAAAEKADKVREAQIAAAEKASNPQIQREAAAEKAAEARAVAEYKTEAKIAALAFAEKVAKAREAVFKTEDTVPKWAPERNSDNYQTIKKVSPEEAKQRMEEMFGRTGLPMPGFSEGLKDPLLTEKEMFDRGMMQKAYSPKEYDPPKVKPWWQFW